MIADHQATRMMIDWSVGLIVTRISNKSAPEFNNKLCKSTTYILDLLYLEVCFYEVDCSVH